MSLRHRRSTGPSLTDNSVRLAKFLAIIRPEIPIIAVCGPSRDGIKAHQGEGTSEAHVTFRYFQQTLAGTLYWKTGHVDKLGDTI